MTAMQAEDLDDEQWTHNTVTELGRLAGVKRVVVLASDGMLKGASGDLARDNSETIAAAASAVQSTARQLAVHMSSDPQTIVRQVVAETSDGFLLTTAAGPNTHLAIYTDRNADIGNLSYQVHAWIAKLGERVLFTAPRATGR